jgi:hypothetical protein
MGDELKPPKEIQGSEEVKLFLYLEFRQLHVFPQLVKFFLSITIPRAPWATLLRALGGHLCSPGPGSMLFPAKSHHSCEEPDTKKALSRDMLLPESTEQIIIT